MITQSNVKTGTTWHEYFSRVVFLQKFQKYGRERERETLVLISHAISKLHLPYPRCWYNKKKKIYIYIYILNLN